MAGLCRYDFPERVLKCIFFLSQERLCWFLAEKQSQCHHWLIALWTQGIQPWHPMQKHEAAGSLAVW
jgi:hypothetical protein